MPLIFSKSKESNDSVADFKGSTCTEILVDDCYPCPGKNASSLTPDFSICKDSVSKIPNDAHLLEELEEDSIIETTSLRQTSEPQKSPPDNTTTNDNCLTVTGTIKRGKRKGQSVEVVLNMSREELEILQVDRSFKNCCHCSLKNGIGFHIFLWSVFCFAPSVIIAAIYSFCMGTITWYNVFKLFSENQVVCYRICIPPLLMVLYPFLIISVSLGLGFYSGVKQLSCCWDSWKKEFFDYEKGFFGWLCNSLDVPECSPYEVVILSSIQKM